MIFKISLSWQNQTSRVWGGTLLKLEERQIYQTFWSLLLMVSGDASYLLTRKPSCTVCLSNRVNTPWNYLGNHIKCVTKSKSKKKKVGCRTARELFRVTACDFNMLLHTGFNSICSALGMAMWIHRSLHHFSHDWNISTNIGWISMYFFILMNGPQRMNPIDLWRCDFHLAPPPS